MEFHEQRRQQFLNERYYQYFCKCRAESAEFWRVNLPANGESEKHQEVLAASSVADEVASLFLLKYTGGESLDTLRDELSMTIEAYERYTRYRREYQKDSAFPPFFFAEIDEYERAMQLIGLCYLLHRRDLLPRVASMLDGEFGGKDTLYEDLLAYELEGRYDVDEWYHDTPYRGLINSLYRDTREESIADIEKYLQAWYKSMKRAPWHDSHFDMTEKGGAYFGYWAIEAGAVAYLLELDDSSFREHIVYPKDLVDYARELDKRPQSLASSEGPGDDMRLRVEGGKPCPQTGYWFTPAKANSRCHFEEGDIMPVYGGSDYGVTIWQWSPEQ